jgi:hypothetical protein
LVVPAGAVAILRCLAPEEQGHRLPRTRAGRHLNRPSSDSHTFSPAAIASAPSAPPVTRTHWASTTELQRPKLGKDFHLLTDETARRTAEHLGLWAKVQAGTATQAEGARFSELHAERARTILATPPEALFTVTPVEAPAPVAPRAPRPSVACAGCGEMVVEAKVHLVEGRKLCGACSARAVVPAA